MKGKTASLPVNVATAVGKSCRQPAPASSDNGNRQSDAEQGQSQEQGHDPRSSELQCRNLVTAFGNLAFVFLASWRETIETGWMKSFTQSLQDAKNTSEGTGSHVLQV
jgi:hypothetical protein